MLPKQNSSSGKERQGGIFKQGDRYLRRLLVLGATAVIRLSGNMEKREPPHSHISSINLRQVAH